MKKRNAANDQKVTEPDVIHRFQAPCRIQIQFDLIIEFKNMDVIHDNKNSHNKSGHINDGDDHNDNNRL